MDPLAGHDCLGISMWRSREDDYTAHVVHEVSGWRKHRRGALALFLLLREKFKSELSRGAQTIPTYSIIFELLKPKAWAGSHLSYTWSTWVLSPASRLVPWALPGVQNQKQLLSISWCGPKTKAKTKKIKDKYCLKCLRAYALSYQDFLYKNYFPCQSHLSTRCGKNPWLSLVWVVKAYSKFLLHKWDQYMNLIKFTIFHAARNYAHQCFFFDRSLTIGPMWERVIFLSL